MNPSNSHIPPAELPPVAESNNEQLPPQEAASASLSAPETEQQFGMQNEQPSQGAPADPQTPPPASQPTDDTSAPTAASTPHDDVTPPAAPPIADDTDLIEKEWVIKAKQIVLQTRDDPYQQNKAVNKLKADYVRTRFNKEIKLSDD